MIVGILDLKSPGDLTQHDGDLRPLRCELIKKAERLVLERLRESYIYPYASVKP